MYLLVRIFMLTLYCAALETLMIDAMVFVVALKIISSYSFRLIGMLCLQLLCLQFCMTICFSFVFPLSFDIQSFKFSYQLNAKHKIITLAELN